MRRITKIDFLENNQLLCLFENQELRVLNLPSLLKDKYGNKILLNENIFKTAKIGDLGEIYWPNMAEMQDENGELQSCAYDISPEFAYFHSTLMEK